MKKAFTIIELLVVIGIIAILLGMIFPSYFGILEKAKVTKAHVEVKNLETAFKNYLDIYRVWPVGAEGLHVVSDAQAIKLFSMLRGTDTGLNPQGISFYEFSGASNNWPAANTAYDPWADPAEGVHCLDHVYYVMFDIAYDNTIHIAGHPDIRRPAIVWSAGPNGTNEYGEGDDIASWK